MSIDHAALAGTLGALALGLVAVLPAQSGAAPATIAEIALYNGPDRQAILEAGAKKEGEYRPYMTGTQLDPILERFQQKYPFVKAVPHRLDSDVVARKVIEEYKAGRYTVDGYMMNTGGLQALRDAGVLQPFYSPEMASFKKEAIQPDKLWVVDKESYLSFGYNTKAYSDKDVPQTYDDMLDPKWKGKFAMSTDGTTFTTWIGAIVLSKGEDFLRQLGKQEFKFYNIGGRGVSNMVVSGEIPISPAIYSGHMRLSKAKGANVGWKAVGAVYSNLGGVALASKSPHPHATMLLIDFSLSREGQKMYQDLGYETGRLDLENSDKPEEILYVTERPNFHKEFEYWGNLIRPVFMQKN